MLVKGIGHMCEEPVLHYWVKETRSYGTKARPCKYEASEVFEGKKVCKRHLKVLAARKLSEQLLFDLFLFEGIQASKASSVAKKLAPFLTSSDLERIKASA